MSLPSEFARLEQSYVGLKDLLRTRDAEIAALRAEIHLLRILEKSLPVCQKENDGLRAAATSLVEQNDSLRAEVERLRKDAERWRAALADYEAGVVMGSDHGVAPIGYISRFLHAIRERDAAMRQEPKA